MKRRRNGEKVDQSKVVDIKSLRANPLQEVPFLKQPALLVKAFVGNNVYVANTGDKDVTIKRGTLLCGYGKGRFAHNKHGGFNPDCHHMYNIKTCDDFVFTTKMTTMKKVVAEHRANNWEAKIAYHTMCDIASTDKDAFGVKLEHEVFFIPAFTSDEDGGQSQPITQSTLAGKLPPPIPSRTHTASWRHGLSSGLPRVWALSVRWSSSRNRASSLLARPCPCCEGGVGLFVRR